MDGTVVITGDLYVAGTIYEGDNPGDDTFDSLNEISSGANTKELRNETGDSSELKIASNDLSDSNNSSDVQENKDSSDSLDDSGFILDDDMFGGDTSSNNSTKDFNTSNDYVELEEFLALSNEVRDLANKIDMVSLELKETQQYMREGFAMSSALAAMPTPTNYGLNFSAGAGNYDGSNALAFGFVYVKENYVINVGHAKSDTGGKTMTNIGFTYNISSWFKK